MEINYLREFVVLTQTSNFLEAADILYSSQSSLSKHLQSLEKELGVPLFDRTTRKVSLSKYGQLLLPYAKQIVELQDKYSAVMQSSLETNREVLTIGSIPSLAQYNITDVIVRFKKSRAQSILNVLQGGSEELKELLRHRKCELAFIGDFDEIDDDLTKIPFADDQMVAVLPAGHSLAKKKKVPLSLLADEDFLFIEKQTIMYRLSVKVCQQSGFEPKVALTDHKVENLIDLVIKGMGVALMMKRHASYHASSKVSAVEIDPTITTQISLCYLRDIELSEPAKHFIICLNPQ